MWGGSLLNHHQCQICQKQDFYFDSAENVSASISSSLVYNICYSVLTNKLLQQSKRYKKNDYTISIC